MTRTGRQTGLGLFAWATVLVLGLLHLAYPVSGDQALFLHYARAIDRGATLYIDVWDNKQPGIIGFYWLAGHLAGFDSVGMHLVEWLWIVAATALMVVAGRLALTTRWPVALLPLLTGGLYYWCAGDWFLTQVEGLVSLPLAGCLLAGVAAQRWPDRAAGFHVFFGVCAGCVAIFKLLLGVLPAAMWLILIAANWDEHRHALRTLLTRCLLPVCLGALIPLMVCALYFVQQGAWQAFLWTTFSYPPQAVQEVAAKPWRQLVRSSAWLIWLGAAMTPACLLSLSTLRQQRLRPLELMALAWLFAGAAMILVQKLSWWPYHFLMLVFPLGVLAVCAFDRLADPAARSNTPLKARRVAWVAALSVLAMFSLTRKEMVAEIQALRAAGQAPAGEHLTAFRQALDPHYRERIEATAFLRQGTDPKPPIYVFGNPNWMLEAGRDQAIAVHGWAWESMLESQWQALPAQLTRANPSHLYVDADYAPMINRRSPATAALIRDRYRPVARTTEGGTWYEALMPAHAAGTPTAAPVR